MKKYHWPEATIEKMLLPYEGAQQIISDHIARASHLGYTHERILSKFKAKGWDELYIIKELNKLNVLTKNNLIERVWELLLENYSFEHAESVLAKEFRDIILIRTTLTSVKSIKDKIMQESIMIFVKSGDEKVNNYLVQHVPNQFINSIVANIHDQYLVMSRKIMTDFRINKPIEKIRFELYQEYQKEVVDYLLHAYEFKIKYILNRIQFYREEGFVDADIMMVLTTEGNDEILIDYALKYA